jgi:hypothetical protein
MLKTFSQKKPCKKIGTKTDKKQKKRAHVRVLLPLPGATAPSVFIFIALSRCGGVFLGTR